MDNKPRLIDAFIDRLIELAAGAEPWSRGVLWRFGWTFEYVCTWGVYTHRYDGIDRMSGRPIHSGMSVAPPWAKARIVRKKS